MLTVRTVHECIDRFAPFETAEAYDNVGLLVGSWDAPVLRILCTLDVTMATVDEAVQAGADLIVSHHPLMFHGRKTLIEGDPEADVIRALVSRRLNLIAAHTNWDQSVLSGSASVAGDLGVQDLRQEGYLFTGSLPKPLDAVSLKHLIEERIKAPVRMYGDPKQTVSVMSFGGGAYGEGYSDALKAGAQAYLTGKIRHHEIIDAVARGLVIYDAGHYASEAPMVPRLVRFLKEQLPEATDVLESHYRPFEGALISTSTPEEVFS